MAESEPRLQTTEINVNMGPQHPATHGVFRMVLAIDGERVVDVTPHIGYLHRGSEKLAEGLQYHQITPLFDRMAYPAAMNNELVYCMAVEKLMGLEVPERAQYIRVLMCELNRIASHFLFLSSIGLDTGALTPGLYAFRGRERLMAFFEAAAGARLLPNYFVVGGVREDLHDGWKEQLSGVLSLVEFDTDEVDKLLTYNEVFVTRTRNVALIDGRTAIEYGALGPVLRASGVPYDVRKAEPYMVYDRLDFDIPRGENGDCWDRYYVRLFEVRQSLRIVRQAMERIPEGPVQGLRRPTGIRPPKGEAYARSENPTGEIGVYLVSDGSSNPYRVKVRPPSFCNLMALKHLLREAYVADIGVILGTLDIVLGEVDR